MILQLKLVLSSTNPECASSTSSSTNKYVNFLWFHHKGKTNILSNLPIVKKNNCKDTYKYGKLYRQHITKDVKSILYMPVQVYTTVWFTWKICHSVFLNNLDQVEKMF